MQLRKKVIMSIIGAIIAGVVASLTSLDPETKAKAIAGITVIFGTFNIGQGIADFKKETRVDA